jgi:HD-GYP domain-containing protein (c-di-GMP phosphodiesterase class II)
MRKISLETTQPGMVVARTVLGGNNQVLLKTGTEIKPQYVDYLHKLGVSSIYVKDKRMDDIEIYDVVSDETRNEARLLVKTILNDIKMNKPGRKSINTEKEIVDTVTKLIDELLSNRDILIQLTDVRTSADYMFAHSVNCSILAGVVAAKMGYDRTTLKQLTTGALLHDIGMVAIPEQILNKPGELTMDEITTINMHPLYGYEIFKKSSIYHGLAGTIIAQHHEKYNGQGYPYGLKEDEINPLAQIVGIANIYDALTSDRPYRKAYHPHEAVEMIIAWGNDLFDIEILQNFLAVVAAYPIGYHVMLSSGESGLVVGNNPGFTLRPIVRVLYTGEDLAPHPAPYDIDLSKSLNLVISKVID